MMDDKQSFLKRQREMQVNVKEKCKKCDGGVRVAYSIHGNRMGMTECPYCGGSGKVTKLAPTLKYSSIEAGKRKKLESN